MPLIAKVSVRLKRAAPKVQRKELIDWGKLADKEMKDKYLIDVKNRYEVLSLETDKQDQVPVASKIEQNWQHLKESIQCANGGPGELLHIDAWEASQEEVAILLLPVSFPSPKVPPLGSFCPPTQPGIWEICRGMQQNSALHSKPRKTQQTGGTVMAG